MKVIDTKLQDVKIIEMDVFGDHRGFFTESYSKAKFAEHGLDFDFVVHAASLFLLFCFGLIFVETSEKRIKTNRKIP